VKSLTIEEFGTALIRTRDLDPVYVALRGALNAKALNRAQISALLISYWCFYHLGAASYIAEKSTSDKKFWDLLMEAAVNERSPGVRPYGERWPRAAERRHFRGGQAMAAVKELASKYQSPLQALDGMLGASTAPTYSSVSGCVKLHRGFGPWIAFKVADMAERVLGMPVSFDDCELGIYKDPRQGAALAYIENLAPPALVAQPIHKEKPWTYPVTDYELKQAVDHYVRYFRSRKLKAPPFDDRPVGVQEIETIFCKYKSHRKGHYTVGKDIAEVRHGLVGWGDLADELRKHAPPLLPGQP